MDELTVHKIMRRRGYVYVIFPQDISLDPLYAKTAEHIGPLLRDCLPNESNPDIRQIEHVIKNMESKA